jgi:hypothetical protein
MFGSDMGFFRSVPGNRDNVRITSLQDGSISGEDVEDEGEVQSAGDEI